MQPLGGAIVQRNLGNTISGWQTTILQTAVTLAVIGFAAAFFAQNAFGLLGFGIAGALGALSLWSNKETEALNRLAGDMQEVAPQLDRLDESTSKVKELTKELAESEKNLKSFGWRFRVRILELRLIKKLFARTFRDNSKSLNPQLTDLIAEVQETTRRFDPPPPPPPPAALPAPPANRFNWRFWN